MSSNLKKLVSLIGGGGLICSIVISLLMVKKYADYRMRHPPVTRATSEICEKRGLVAHWKFDSISALYTPDEMGYANGKIQYAIDIKYMSNFFYGLPEQVEGRNGKAFEFNRKQWVAAGNKSCFNAEIFTITAWVWQESDEYHIPTIASKSSWPYDGWWLCTKDRFVDLGISWGNGRIHVESGYQIPLKEWHHIAISVNNIDHEVQFYIDGIPYGEKHINVHNWLVNWNHDLFLAGYDGSGQWSWPGKLDDVRFYSGILSKEEISGIFTDIE